MLSVSRHHHGSDNVHHHHWRLSLYATGVLCQSRGHLPVGKLPVCLPVRHWVRCSQLFHHGGGDEEAQKGEGFQRLGFRGLECLFKFHVTCLTSPPSLAADPQLIQRRWGYGFWWLLPWQWNWPDFFSGGLQHPKHREEHPGPKLHCVCTHRRHQATQGAPFKTKPQLHNEQQLHDRLLLQNFISAGLPALQHHLLELVFVAY